VPEKFQNGGRILLNVTFDAESTSCIG